MPSEGHQVRIMIKDDMKGSPGKSSGTLFVRSKAAVSRYRSRESAGLSLQSLIHSSTRFCSKPAIFIGPNTPYMGGYNNCPCESKHSCLQGQLHVDIEGMTQSSAVQSVAACGDRLLKA